MWHHLKLPCSTYSLLEDCTALSLQAQVAAIGVRERTPMASNGDDGCEQSSLQDEDLSMDVCRPCAVAMVVGAGDSECVVPDFPVPDRLQPERVSEVSAIDPAVHTAKARQRGAHLGSAARSKRSAQNAFKNVAMKLTSYEAFQHSLLRLGNGSGTDMWTIPAGSCTSECRERTGSLGCLVQFGDTPIEAVNRLFENVRVKHVGETDVTKKRQRAHIDRRSGVRDMSDIRRRLLQKARRDRLVEALENSLYFDPATGTDGTFEYEFKLPCKSGRMLPVCKHFFRTVMGYDASDRQWRKAFEDVKTAIVKQSQNNAAVGAVPDNDTHIDTEGLGTKGRTTLAWFATFIKLYTVQMPMVKELRIDFAKRKHLYAFLKKQYVFATQRSQETVDKYFFVSLSRFRQLLDDVGRYRVIRDAIAEKVGTIPDRASEWKLKFHDPTKKRDFKVCTCCAKIAETRTGAVAAGNATLFNQQILYMDAHTLVVAARRNQFICNQRLAVERPHQHLSFICDGMAHNQIDGPVLGRQMRHAKDTASSHKMPTHLVGGLSWGAGGHRTWCYFYDLLVQGGANNTCEVIVRTLERLAAAGELPTDPELRVLHLQCDNCPDNKNWVVLLLCALLVRSGVFTKVELDFLHVGHTHEVIDQVFAVISHWLSSTNEDVSTGPPSRT